ncbi:MAG: hypothetical protein ACOYMN_22360, partial [Roseimicrobium sp.]
MSAPHSRLWVLLVVILASIIIPFILLGSWIDSALNLRSVADGLAKLGPWGWLGGLALLVSDLILPIPSTVIISALGLAYGWAVGGLLG